MLSRRRRSTVTNTEDTVGRTERGSRGDGQSAPGPEPRIDRQDLQDPGRNVPALTGPRRTAIRSEAIARRMDCPCSLTCSSSLAAAGPSDGASREVRGGADAGAPRGRALRRERGAGPHAAIRKGGAGSLSDATWIVIRNGGRAMRPLRGFGILVLTIVLAAAWGCGSTATKEGTGEYVDDSVITAKVKTAIFNDASLKVNEINVETFKGVVQLSGFVRSQADIDKAVQVARGVAGVKSVKNDMRIK
jgi:hypothetical protein